jgi:gentisate 1,2-dioxygenase
MSTKPDLSPQTTALEGDAPSAPDTPFQARARFFNSGNAFNLKLPAVPRARFDGPRDAAMAEDAGTGIHPMDQSAAIGCRFPATTPMVLARYLRINPGEVLSTRFRASGEIHYVIQGKGVIDQGSGKQEFGTGQGGTGQDGTRIAVSAGDVIVLPGGIEVTHGASEDGALVLWSVTNEPMLAFENMAPPEAGEARIEPVHYTAAEIDRQIATLTAMPMAAEQAGVALIFSSERTADSKNAMPSLTLALNTLEAGARQRAHVHNAAAITLAIQGEGCFSMIDGEKISWSPFATMVTPPAEVHSHHNAGPSLARFLIVQDGGLHYHARTMGFTFRE